MEETKLRHLAIIMDGNRRWAKLKNKSKKDGHKAGAEKLKEATEWCIEFGVSYLTVYAFSTENWKREESEVRDIMLLLREYLSAEQKDFIKMGVNIRVIGMEDKLDKALLADIREIEKSTSHNSKLFLNIAFNYGGRMEVIEATKKIAEKVKNNIIKIEDINEDIFKENMYSPSTPDPDLVIRTGEQCRISNFLLWQIAYSELYFTDTLWPNFSKDLLGNIINNFNNRERKYGGK